MRPVFLPILAAASVWAGSPKAFAEEEAPPSPVEITLVSEAACIAPGQGFSVGILQRIQPGYHTYWRNPGTVGLPFSIQWDLPAGFRTNAIQWPTPELSKMAAYTVWGYHNEALLVVDLVAPPDLQPGTRARIAGTAIWMCCAANCHPGHKRLELELPVASEVKINPEWTRRFDATRADQPRVSRNWKIACAVSGKQYRLSVSATTRDAELPSNIRFFDYDRQISSDRAQRVKRRPRSAILRLFQEEHTGEKLPRLRGILVADGEWEPGVKVLAVDVPIAGRD